MFDLVVVHMLGYHWVGNLTFAAYMVSTTFALSSLIGFYHTYAKELQVSRRWVRVCACQGIWDTS